MQQSELRDMVIEMGSSETEWQWLMEEAQRILNEASSHFQARNYTDGFTAASRASAINPFLIPALVIKARSALMLWQRDSNETFRNEAELAARRILEIQPGNSDGASVLSAVSNRSHQATVEKKSKKMVFVAIGVLLIGLAAGLVFMVSAGGDESTDGGASNERTDDIQNDEALALAEEEVNAAWAQVVNVIRRRAELIPQVAALLSQQDEDAAQMQEELKTLQDEMDAVSSDAEALGAVNRKLTTLLSRVSPQLANTDSKALETLMIQLEGAANRISIEKERYNQAVKKYNNLLRKVDKAAEPKPYLE
jgi:hypothetical protein